MLTAKAATQTIPVEILLVGSVEASETVEIKPQVSGQIAEIHFAEGAMVRKNDLLFSIEDRTFRQALLQAESLVARDKAALRQAQATVSRDSAQSKYAEVEAERYLELAKGGIISKTQFDQLRTTSDVAKATLLASQAAIESAQANLASDLAAVEKAKIDIAYCSIRSPIAGRAGTLMLHVGNVVRANETPLVVVNRITPVFVTFNAPERYLPSIRKLSASGKLPVRASLKDNPSAAATGSVSVIDNAVDPGTGSIRLKASFENRDGLLWPGQFADVVLRLGGVQNATLVPSEAVQPGQKGPFVFRVKPDQTVELVQVTTGETFEGKTAIEGGLRPGDVVVTDGHLRLSPGSRIKKGVDPAASVTR